MIIPVKPKRKDACSEDNGGIQIKRRSRSPNIFFNDIIQGRFIPAVPAMNFHLIAAHRKNRNKTKMEIGTVNIHFMVIGSAGIAHIFSVKITTNPDPSDSENE